MEILQCQDYNSAMGAGRSNEGKEAGISHQGLSVQDNLESICVVSIQTLCKHGWLMFPESDVLIVNRAQTLLSNHE